MEVKNKEQSYQGLNREQEEKQLARIIQIAQQKLTRTENYIKELSEDMIDIVEHSEDRDAQAMARLNNAKALQKSNIHNLLRCQKARKKPYFGWIAFEDSSTHQNESYYIGRVGIQDDDSQSLVIDWRAPVASTYYENQMGPCTYLVNNEDTYEINLQHKRTYEIADDKLIAFYDSDIVATDELLTKYLGKSKKAVLGEIIATIQKEQNQIIRTSPKTNLIVQGVAGSGKTTVAMHRISYILYNYEEFRPEDFYIIGSNHILLNYITSILPDLDVYGVSQMTMEQLFTKLLYEDWQDHLFEIAPLDRNDNCTYVKASLEWFKDLETFCNEYEQKTISTDDVRMEKNGVILMTHASIKHYMRNNELLSMQGKINLLNEFLDGKLESEFLGRGISYPADKKKELKKFYRYYFGKDKWNGSIYEFYEEFLHAQSLKGKTVELEPGKYDVYDLAALSYLYKRIKETDGIREASHVIIDEAQDFGMMAYSVLKYCLRGCTYTIMGDVSQNIHYGYGLNDWNELQDLILTNPFDTFGLLKKSYRNTVEISNFATEILRHGNFSIYPVEPIIRHGNPVETVPCKDSSDMLQQTVKILTDWQKEGYETIAVICRTDEQADDLQSKLGELIPLKNTSSEIKEFETGITVLSVGYTKGLEFDAVLLYDPSTENYPDEDQYVKLLYVAATRALHQLTIVHAGDVTPLISKPVSIEKRMQSLENQMRPQAKRYEKRIITKKEQQTKNIIQADKERALRGTIGPKPIVVNQPSVKPATPKKESNQPSVKPTAPKKESPLKKVPTIKAPRPAALDDGKLNPSPYKFNSVVEDASILLPAGHGRIDNRVLWVKRTKKHLDISSNYGLLRITPASEEIIHVQFHKSQDTTFKPTNWDYESSTPITWTAKESKFEVQLFVGHVLIKIEKNTGAIKFCDTNGRVVLAEKDSLPRQIELGQTSGKTWNYFDWSKKEIIYAKGILSDDFNSVRQKARYISFGGKKLRMPLIISKLGYGLGFPNGNTVLCCSLPMYGTYVSTESTDQIDYYFLAGGTKEHLVELYNTVIGKSSNKKGL